MLDNNEETQNGPLQDSHFPLKCSDELFRNIFSTLKLDINSQQYQQLKEYMDITYWKQKDKVIVYFNARGSLAQLARAGVSNEGAISFSEGAGANLGIGFKIDTRFALGRICALLLDCASNKTLIDQCADDIAYFREKNKRYQIENEAKEMAKEIRQTIMTLFVGGFNDKVELKKIFQKRIELSETLISNNLDVSIAQPELILRCISVIKFDDKEKPSLEKKSTFGDLFEYIKKVYGDNTQEQTPSSTEILQLFEGNHFHEWMSNAYLSSSYYFESGKIAEFIAQTVEGLSKGQLPSHIGDSERAEDIFGLVNQAFAMSKDTSRGDTFIAYLNEKLKSTGASLVLTQERTGIKGANAPCKLTLANGENYTVIIGPYDPWITIKK